MAEALPKDSSAQELVFDMVEQIIKSTTLPPIVESRICCVTQLDDRTEKRLLGK